MMYIAEKAFFFKSSTFRQHFFLPCLCIREGAQKLSHNAWLKADLFCQGYSKFNLLAIVWGDMLSQALCCASAAFQLLAALLGRAQRSWGLFVKVPGYVANLNLHLWNLLFCWASLRWPSAPMCCGFGWWEMRFLYQKFLTSTTRMPVSYVIYLVLEGLRLQIHLDPLLFAGSECMTKTPLV